jgi:hypothetical protein
MFRLQTLPLLFLDPVTLLLQLGHLRMQIGWWFDLLRRLKAGVGEKLLLLLLFI